MILPQRYIFAGLAKTILTIALVVIGVACIGRSLTFVDYIVNHGLAVTVYLYLMLLLMPMLMLGLLPIATFASVMFIYSKLTLDNELVVLRAAGMSMGALAQPAVVISLAAMLLCFSMSAYFVPLSFAEFKNIEFRLRTQMGAMLLKEGEFNLLGPKVTIYFAKQAKSGILTGVLMQDDRDVARSRTAIAERATIALTGDVHKVVLFGGNIQEYDRQTRKVSIVYFDRYVMEIDSREFETGLVRERGIAERGLFELLNPPTSTPRDRELVGRALSEGHQRIALPLLCLTYAAIALAAMLAGPYSRRGLYVRILTACAAVVGIQAANLVLVSAAALAPVLLAAIHLNALLPGMYCVALLGRDNRRLARSSMLPWSQRDSMPDTKKTEGAA